MAWERRENAVRPDYGAKHRARRRSIQKRMDAGESFTCWRCGKPIHPRSGWHLGHDDDDAGRYRGPEHDACSQLSGSAKGGRSRPRETRPGERHPGLA